MPAPRATAVSSYLAASFGWLVVMAIWAAVTGPHGDPRCHGAFSFGFLPAAMVVPFAVLILYAFTVIIHVPFAFSRRRIEAHAQGQTRHFLDAAIFIPFAALSIFLLAAVMRWDSSMPCFEITAVLALPWLVTPWVNTCLLTWSHR